MVNLYKNKKSKTKQIHQLVAIAFHNHIPCGHKLVINHKDFNRLNNNKDNLEIVTVRENTSKKHLKSFSKYTGVSFEYNKWKSRIVIDGKVEYLGSYGSEKEAGQSYQNKLKEIING